MAYVLTFAILGFNSAKTISFKLFLNPSECKIVPAGLNLPIKTMKVLRSSSTSISPPPLNNFVKVWVFKGEIMAHDPMAQDKRMSEQQLGGPQR